MIEVSNNSDHCQQIVILSGPSGSGKSTIVNRLIEECPVKLVKMISATTRSKRVGEVDGEDYYFISVEEFERRRLLGAFIECENVYSSGNWYGTLKSELNRAEKLCGWAFLEIDVNGALRVMEIYPEAISIFVRAGSDSDYETRLRGRGTESEEVIQRRLANARRELELAHHYRYQICNDQLERAVAEIIQILVAHKGEVVCTKNC